MWWKTNCSSRPLGGKDCSCTRCICTKIKKASSSSECEITEPVKSVWDIIRRNRQMNSYRFPLMQQLSIISMRYYLRDYFNDRVFVVHIPLDLQLFCQKYYNCICWRIMLKAVQEKIDFRLDICSITKGSQSEHL